MVTIPEPYKTKFKNGINHPELFLWDAWSYLESDRIHLYCLAVSRKKNDGSNLDPNKRNDVPFHIRHFTSDDNGFSWKDEGCFIDVDKDLKGKYRTIWSGSVQPLPTGEILAAYTGIVDVDSEHRYLQTIALASSTNGYKLAQSQERELSSPIRDFDEIMKKGYYLDSLPDLGSNKGEENGPIMAWRDPFIFYDKTNELNLFWAAKINPTQSALARTTLKKTEKGYTIKELFPPATVSDYLEFTQLEVPKIVWDKAKGLYYLMISACNRLYEEQPDSEITKEVRFYKAKDINGPWESMGDSILGNENLFGPTILRTDFDNNRLLCIAPYTEKSTKSSRLTFAKPFYVYLETLNVEFL